MAIARGLFQQNTKKSLVWNFEIKYFRLSLYGNMVLFYYSCVCLFCIVVLVWDTIIRLNENESMFMWLILGFVTSLDVRERGGLAFQ